jgi:hypothetical protein
VGHLKSDIRLYTGFPDCEALIYFIYDPDNFLTNPQELQAQLEELANDNLALTVFISPQIMWK